VPKPRRPCTFSLSDIRRWLGRAWLARTRPAFRPRRPRAAHHSKPDARHMASRVHSFAGFAPIGPVPEEESLFLPLLLSAK